MNFNQMTKERMVGAAIMKAAWKAVNSYIAKNGVTCITWEDREDVVMGVTDKIWSNIRKFDSTRSQLSTWVSTAAVRDLITLIRWKNMRNGKCTVDSTIIDEYEWRSSSSSDDEILLLELEGNIGKVLEKRSEKDGTIFDLYVNGSGPKEISEQLGVTANSVSLVVNRIRKELDRALAS